MHLQARMPSSVQGCLRVRSLQGLLQRLPEHRVMANNRMWLKNKRTGAKVLLAKYYPATGWYPFPADLHARLGRLFDENEPAPSQWGDNDWLIEYEQEAADQEQQAGKITFESASNDWIFSSGRRRRAYTERVSIIFDAAGLPTVSYGYDGDLWEAQEFIDDDESGRPPDERLSKDDLRELAERQIQRWQQFMEWLRSER